MKHITTTILALIIALAMTAQDKNYMPISVEIGDAQELFPEAARTQLQNRLNMMLTHQNIVSVSGDNRFVLYCIAVPADKDILAGPPSQIVETMDLTLFIADAAAEMVFASLSQTVKGVGTTEARAYMDSFKHLRIEGKDIDDFVAKGISQINEYYAHEADRIIKEALAMAEAHEYEAAISHVMLVPTQCQAYNRALDTGVQIFHQYQDYVCNENLQKARMLWAAEQNKRGAMAAGELLAQIYPDAGCYPEAMSLYKEIKNKVLDDWKFEMKQYQDGIDIEKQRIDAMRQIGVAYGQHQQPQTYNYGFLYR